MNRPRVAVALLATLILFHVFANLLWLRVDNHVIRIDEEFHATGARDYYVALASPEYAGLSERLHAIGKIESPYPPLLHILGALLAFVFGYSRDIIVLAGTLSFILTLLGVYRVSRTLFDHSGALLSTTVVSLIPILFAGSRYMALENLIAAIVVWAIYALWRSEGFHRVGWSALFGLLNGAAILTKPNAFVYYLPASAVVFLLGLILACRSPEQRGKKLGRITFNGVLSVALAIVVFAPWFLWHRDYLEQYWLHDHKGGRTPFTFVETVESPTGPVEAEPLPAPVPSPTSAPTVTPPPSEAPSQFTIRLSSLLERGWLSYPINIVNNAAFLPLTLLGLLGLPLLFLRKERRPAAWMVVVWMVGAYLFMTLAFRHTTPRYTMPFIAPLGIGAAALVLAMPTEKIRRGFALTLVALLSWQFLHMTTGARIMPERIYLPLMQEHDQVTRYLDKGLAIEKRELIAGTYCFAPPEADTNYVDRILMAMQANERRKGTPDGHHIPYLALWRQNNFGGLRFEAPAWGPDPNVLLRPSLKNDPGARYDYERIHQAYSPEEAALYLDDAEYVVVILADREATRADQFYHRFYSEVRGRQPMMLIDYFDIDAYGKLPAALVGLMARKKVVPVLESSSLFDLADDFDLATWMGPQFEAVHEDRRTTFDANTELQPMNESVGYGLMQIRRVSEHLVQFRALFKCESAMDRDWRVSFEVSKIEGDNATRTSHNISPDVPTSEWIPGNYYLVDRFCPIPPGTYYSRLFFFDNEHGVFGSIIDPGPPQQI